MNGVPFVRVTNPGGALTLSAILGAPTLRTSFCVTALCLVCGTVQPVGERRPMSVHVVHD